MAISMRINPPGTGLRQSGDALVEALVAVAIMLAVGLGLAYTAGRSVSAQAQSNAHYLWIAGVRDYLQQSGTACPDANDRTMTVCLGKTLGECNACKSNSANPCPHVDVVLDCESVALAVNGQNLSLSRLVSVATTAGDSAAVALFGGDGYLRLSLE